MPVLRPHNQLYEKPPMVGAARTGFGGNTPTAIQATCIFRAEMCCRIKGEWYVFDDGFIRITYRESIDALEQWYQTSQD